MTFDDLNSVISGLNDEYWDWSGNTRHIHPWKYKSNGRKVKVTFFGQTIWKAEYVNENDTGAFVAKEEGLNGDVYVLKDPSQLILLKPFLLEGARIVILRLESEAWNRIKTWEVPVGRKHSLCRDALTKTEKA